jgi:hypothetical protein
MLSEIVNVSITRETQAVSQAGFGIVNILGKNLNSASRLQYFSVSDLQALSAVLLGGTNAPEYLAAQSIAAQSPRPVQFAVSSVLAPRIITDNAGTFTAGSIVVTVNGTAVTQAYDGSGKDTTMTALAAQIQDLSTVATAVYNSGSHIITITPEANTPLSISVDVSGITGSMTATVAAGTEMETYTQALNNIKLYDNGWYGLVVCDRDPADVQLIAAWAESNTKIYITTSADANIVDVSDASDTTSIAALLKASGYLRSGVIYHATAASAYPEAGYLANKLCRAPGSYTAMFKAIAGLAVSSLTTTQLNNARDKNVVVYTSTSAINMTWDGKVASGEYLDVVHFIDWFSARMAEGVFGLLAREPKVPYTPEGLAAIRAEMEKVGEAGIEAGGLSKTLYDDVTKRQIGGFYATMPLFSSISANDKANRELNNVKFTGFLAGAIHLVTIEGTITY